MADSPDNSKKEETTCCSSGHGRGGRCCCSKALKVLILVLLGGIIGFLMGSHGSYGRHGWRHHCCDYSMSSVAPTPGKASSK